MEFENLNELSDSNFDESINFREVIDKYLIHFKWFIVSIVAILTLAYFYLRKEIPKYQVTSRILIKDKEKGSSVNELGAFEDLGIFGSNNNSLENEIHLLTSRRLMTKVVDELRLNVRYFVESSPYNLEQYPNFPIIVDFPKDSISPFDIENKKINNVNTSFKIVVKNESRFEFIDSEENSKGIKEFGKTFKIDKGEIRININDAWKNKIKGGTFIVVINPLDPIVDKYNNNVLVEPIDTKSRVVGLSIKETVRQKGIAIINNLIEQYNNDAVEDKNQVYQKTTEFLNDRIILITSELTAIESMAEQFKTSKGLIDTRAGAEVYLQSSSLNENELIDANTQFQLVDYMIGELNNNDINGLLPSNIGLSDPSIIALIGEFNSLILQRNRILKSSTELNPLIVNIDSQLLVLKNNLTVTLNNIKSSLSIQVDILNKQRGKIGSRIASVPKNEKEFKDIVRQQETKNAVYLFLLQKREESILSNAITIDKARVVDRAYSTNKSVSPNPGVTYFAAFLIGLLIPTLIIYINDMLDTKVHDEKDLRDLRMPFLGDVPHSSSKKDLLVKDGDNSNIAEAFRYIRTNVNFMVDSKKKSKTIFVTSTQAGEGKTFTAINLASSLAISGKKTILLGMDLRAAKITEVLDIENILGVTNYIKNERLSLEEIIEKFTGIDNLHVINSGDVPPNPVELLMSERAKHIFKYLKDKYEYIIVDTAPVGMVTDTVQIGEFSDLTIYVVKANNLDKRKLHIPIKMNQYKKLPNMALLLNGTDHSKGAYGYGYGYGEKKKRKVFW